MLEISQILLHMSHKPSGQLQKVILRSIYCIVKEVIITFIITSIIKICEVKSVVLAFLISYTFISENSYETSLS